MDSYWATMRKYQPKGPLVASEFYPGWLTHWQQPVGRVPAQPLVDAMRWVAIICLFFSKNEHILFILFYCASKLDTFWTKVQA